MNDAASIEKYLLGRYGNRAFGQCFNPPSLYVLSPIKLDDHRTISVGILHEYNRKYYDKLGLIAYDVEKHLNMSVRNKDIVLAIEAIADKTDCFGSPFELGIIAGRAEAARQFFQNN